MSKPSYLRLAPVTLSILNPQTNGYQQAGRVVIVAARGKDSIALMFAAANNKQIAFVVASADIDWAIQNNVYCSFIDSQRRRLLILFESTQEARIFTAFALSAKLAQSEKPICIIESGKG
jgi:hypothetical protein